MPGSGCSGSGVTTSENAMSASQVTPLSVDLRAHILQQELLGLEGWQLAAVRSRSSYQTARRLPSAATERFGCHWALVGSVLVLSMKGALKVTPLSLERM